jgi:imidazolonepropionase-like amidohydrolase
VKIARALAVLLLAASAARAANTALVGATIHPVSGPEIADGTLIIEGGKILSLGAGLAPPAGATVIDLRGKHLYPGFVHPGAPLGLVEIGSVRGTVDTTEVGDNNAGLRSEVAFNGDSQLLMPAIAGGILTAHVALDGGVVSGTSAVMDLRGWNWRDMTLRAPVGMHLAYPRLTKGRGSQSDDDFDKEKEKALKKLDDLFDAAQSYDRARAAAEAKTGPALDVDPNFEALRAVLAGRLPLFIHAGEKAQIDSALDWAKRRGLSNLVLVSGADAQYAAARLAKERVPVLLDGVLDVPRRQWEPYDAVYAAAAALDAAGVSFAIGVGGDAANARNLPFHAAMAAAFGLSKESALRSVTLWPARILGVADRVGSLEPGKNATLFVSDGDPLEIRSHIERVWIDGIEIDLGANRQYQLYRKYDERPAPAGLEN